MILALRRRHFWWSVVLGVTLPPLYLALVPAAQGEHPAGAAADRDSLGRQPVGPTVVLLREPLVEAERLASPGETPAAIRILSGGDPAIPDLLAYWAPTPGDGSGLPPDARLLGVLRGSGTRILPVPQPDMMQGGYLVLYSLGWNRLVASVPFPSGP